MLPKLLVYTLNIGIICITADDNKPFSSPCPNSTCRISKSSCVLPPFPKHGTYMLSFHHNVGTPGKVVDLYSQVVYSCDDGYYLKGKLNSMVCDEGGVWKGEAPTCEPLSDSVAEEDCPLGMWDHMLTKCVPDCGEWNFSASGQILPFPWQVDVLSYVGSYKYVCSGTIISPKVILTAASCLVDYVRNETSLKDLKVVAGKLYKNYNYSQDINIQIRNINRIYVHPEYKEETNYAFDIAIGFLDNAFESTQMVKQVCVDWLNTNFTKYLAFGNYGEVVFMDKETNHWRLYCLPYMNRSQCTHTLPDLTADKFCTEHTAFSTCNKFIGNGLVFKDTNSSKYYLYGVANRLKNKNSCDQNISGVFTDAVSFLNDCISSV